MAKEMSDLVGMSRLNAVKSPAGQFFVHTPLKVTQNEIRLIRLKQDVPEITIELRHLILGTHAMPEYRALSYTWGPPEPEIEITINYRPFLVRTNLHDFLVEAKRRKYKHWIWIDQISIAQYRIAERNHQVSMMAEIYEGAQEVIVWLGEPRNNAPHELGEYLETVLRAHREPVDMSSSDHGHNSSRSFSIAHNTPYTDVAEVHPKELQAFYVFIQQHYWTRLWVVQEVRLSHHKSIWWGKALFASREIHHLYVMIMRIEMPAWPNLENRNRIPRLLRPVPHAGVRDRNDLSDVLLDVLDRQCEDPRDMIFGIQALLHEGSQMNVDYDNTLFDVLQEAVVIVMAEMWLGRCPELLRTLERARQLRVRFSPAHTSDDDLLNEKFIEFLTQNVSDAWLRDGGVQSNTVWGMNTARHQVRTLVDQYRCEQANRKTPLIHSVAYDAWNNQGSVKLPTASLDVLKQHWIRGRRYHLYTTWRTLHFDDHDPLTHAVDIMDKKQGQRARALSCHNGRTRGRPDSEEVCFCAVKR